MKKASLAIAFLFCASLGYAQGPGHTGAQTTKGGSGSVGGKSAISSQVTSAGQRRARRHPTGSRAGQWRWRSR